MSNEKDYFKNIYGNILSYPSFNITNGTLLLDSLNINKNINVSNYVSSNTLLVLSSLSNINNLITNNIICNNVTSYNIINDNIIINNDAYINNLNCNNITNNNTTNNITILHILNSAFINDITLNINSSLYIRDTSIINNLNVIDTSKINNNIYSSNILSSSLTVFYNANINKIENTNLLNLNNIIVDLEIFNGNIINTNSLTSDYIKVDNINISGNAIINNIYSTNITILENVTINSLFKNNTISVNSIIFSNIKEFTNNIIAKQNKISIFDVYRIGDILKIRIDDIKPIVSLIGDNNIVIYENDNYIEKGINVEDETLTKKFIISIEYENNNYITTPILFVNNDIINNLDKTKIGKHIITYRIYDYENNYINISRNIYINTVDNIIKIILKGDNEIDIGINDEYIEQGARVYNNILQQSPIITGIVDTQTIGTYLIKYETIDNNNNSYHIYRIINVCSKNPLISYDFTKSPKIELIYIDTTFNNLLGDTLWSMECNINIQKSDTFDGIKKIMSLGIFFLGIGRNKSISNKFYISFRGIIKNNSPNLSIGSDTYTSNKIYKSIIEENKWYNIKIKRNGARLNIYINNILHEIVSISSNNIEYDNKILDISTLSINFNDETIMGLISEPKIYDGKNNLIFHLKNNYINSINNRILTFRNSLGINPTITTYNNLIRDSFSNKLSYEDLLFYFKPKNINGFNWNDELGNVVMNSTYNSSTIYLIQNNYGWGSTTINGWKIPNNNFFQNVYWLNGLTISFWIYIKDDYIYDEGSNIIGMNKKRTTYLQTSYVNGFGFSIGPPNTTSNILPYNYLNYNTYNDLSQILSSYSDFYDKGISIDDLRGKWTHIAVTTDSGYKGGTIPTELKIYKNGILINKINDSEFLSNNKDYWAKPNNTSLGNFTYGHSSDAYQPNNMINKIFYGEMMMYNRVLGKYEILDLYNYNKNNYIIKKNSLSSIYDYQLLSKTLIPYYDLSNGYITHNIDFNYIKTFFNFTIEFWIYFTNEISTSNTIFKISNVFELNIGVFNSTYKYIRFSINKDNLSGNKTIYEFQNLLLEKNKWYHITLSKVNEFNIYFYIDGVIKTPIITTSETYMLYKLSYINNNYDMNYIQIGSGVNNIYDISQFKISSKVYQDLYKISNNYSNFIPPNNLEIDDATVYFLEGEKELISNQNIIFTGIVKIIDNPTGISEIILTGSKNIILYKDIDTYIEHGATIKLRFRTINKTQIKIINTVDTSIGGHYVNTYIYRDENIYLIDYRIIKVIEYNLPPNISLNGTGTIVILLNNSYIDPGVTITDYTGDVIIPIISGDTVLTNIIGTYNITYTAINRFGFNSSVSRIVIVKEYGDIKLKTILYSGLDSFYKLEYGIMDNRIEPPGTDYPRVKILFFKNKYFMFVFNFVPLLPFRDVADSFPQYIYSYSTDRINWTPGRYFEQRFPNYKDAKICNVLTTSKYIIVCMFQGAYHIYYSEMYIYRSADGITWDAINPYLLSKPIVASSLRPLYTYVYEVNNVLFQFLSNLGFGVSDHFRVSTDHGDTWGPSKSFISELFPIPNQYNKKAPPVVMYNNGVYFIYSSGETDRLFYYSQNLTTWTYTYVYGKYGHEIIKKDDIPTEYLGSYYNFLIYGNEFHNKLLRQTGSTSINNHFILTGYYDEQNMKDLYVLYFSYNDLEKWYVSPIFPPKLDNISSYSSTNMVGLFTSKIYYINNEYHILGKSIYTCVNSYGVTSNVIIVFKAVSENLNKWIVKKVINDIIVSSRDPNESIYLYNNTPTNCGLEWSDMINGEIFNLNSQTIIKMLYDYRNVFGRNDMHLSDYSIYSFNDLDNNIKYTPIYEFAGGILYDNYWNVSDKNSGTAWKGTDVNKNAFNIAYSLYHGFSISMSITYDGNGWYTESGILNNTGSIEFFTFNVIDSTNKCGIVVNGNNMFFYGTNNTFIKITNNEIIGTNNWLFTIKRFGLIEIYKNNIKLLRNIVTFDYKLLSSILTFGNSFDTKKAFMRNGSIGNIKVWHGVIKYSETGFPIL